MSRAPVTLNIGIGTEQACRAFAEFSKAMSQLGATARHATDRIRPWSLRHQRASHGGNATDARLWPDQWQSTACSAWLHASCPSDAHRLDCTCRCHDAPR